jgi:hypothetical protein
VKVGVEDLEKRCGGIERVGREPAMRVVREYTPSTQCDIHSPFSRVCCTLPVPVTCKYIPSVVLLVAWAFSSTGITVIYDRLKEWILKNM